MDDPTPLSPPATTSAGPGAATLPGRHRALPSGRAVLGGLLVTLAALGAFLVQTIGGPERRDTVVAVTQTMAPGDRLSIEVLETVEVTLPPTVAGTLFADPRSLVGAVLLAPLDAGSVVPHSAVLMPTDGAAAGEPARQVSLALDADRALDGSLRSGERIDLVATLGAGDAATTDVVVEGALVVAVSDHDEAVGRAGSVTVTLAVTDPDAVVAAAHAADVGTIRLVRSTRSR